MYLVRTCFYFVKLIELVVKILINMKINPLRKLMINLLNERWSEPAGGTLPEETSPGMSQYRCNE